MHVFRALSEGFWELLHFLIYLFFFLSFFYLSPQNFITKAIGNWKVELTSDWHTLNDHLPSITKTIQRRRTRHAGHCWRSRDELISDVLLWTPTYGWAKAGRPARTYIQQLWEDTGCSPEDLPEAMNDREKWRERVRNVRASGTIWWWWWWNPKKHLPRKYTLDNTIGYTKGATELCT